MAFPIKPLFDRVIVREIPVDDYFTDEEKKMLPLGDTRMKVRQYCGAVVAVGAESVSGVKVDDIVLYEDTRRYDQIFLRPIDEFRAPDVTYWQIYENDLKGVVIKQAEAAETEPVIQ